MSAEYSALCDTSSDDELALLAGDWLLRSRACS